MNNRFVQRTLSLALSALLTVAMLGSIDFLAVVDTSATGMASQVVSTPRA